MKGDVESYKLAYFWLGCDVLMGFKEFIDIRRTEDQTWLEISNRGSTFERKAIHAYGSRFQRKNFNRCVILRNTRVLSEKSVWNPSDGNKMILLAEYTGPGHCMLRYIAGPVFSEDLYSLTKDSLVYLSSSKFLDKCVILSSQNSSSLGPAVGKCRGGGKNIFALPVLGWPPAAKEWIQRNRKRCWPKQETISKVVREGCQCVPYGQSSSRMKNLEWQLSFSAAECTLMHSLDHASFKLYQILKILISEQLITTRDCRHTVSSHMIRALMFWMCENKLPNFVCAENLIDSIQICLTQLEDWIRRGFIPHYFIPDRNLLKEKMRPLQRSKVLERLIMLKSQVLIELLSCPSFERIRHNIDIGPPRCSIDSLKLAPGILKMRYEFEFFENVGSGRFSSMRWSRALHVLHNFEKAYALDSLSDLQLSIVKQLYYRVANAIGKIAYRLAYNSHSNKRRYSILCLSEVFLRIGCSTDVTSGKLSLASLYFCLRKIRKCLIISESTLRSITPFTVYYRNFGTISNNDIRRQQYKGLMSSDDLPLSLKMKRACIMDVEIIRTSHIWPEAINMEVQTYPPDTGKITVPALIYLYFLRFLGFEITHGNNLKMEALSNLSAISYDEEHNDGSFLSYNIIGICHQRVGQYPEAVEMFCKGAKAGKVYDWMNECLNPGLVRIGIVLNRAFRDNRYSSCRQQICNKPRIQTHGPGAENTYANQ